MIDRLRKMRMIIEDADSKLLLGMMSVDEYATVLEYVNKELDIIEQEMDNKPEEKKSWWRRIH